MKKLINLFEAVAKVDVTKYPNLDFPANKVPGSVPASDSINEVLLQDLNTAAGNAKLKVSVTTAVSGHNTKTKSGNLSRHPGGFAVDIAMINGDGITKQLGDALVAELVKLGYTHSPEENTNKHILWQTKDHYNHVHVSNTTNVASTSVGGETSGEESYDPSSVNDKYTAAAREISRGFAQPIINTMIGQQSESVSLKEHRLIKNIEKIKRLL